MFQDKILDQIIFNQYLLINENNNSTTLFLVNISLHGKLSFWQIQGNIKISHSKGKLTKIEWILYLSIINILSWLWINEPVISPYIKTVTLAKIINGLLFYFFDFETDSLLDYANFTYIPNSYFFGCLYLEIKLSWGGQFCIQILAIPSKITWSLFQPFPSQKVTWNQLVKAFIYRSFSSLWDSNVIR